MECSPILLEYCFRYLYNKKYETYIKEGEHLKTLVELNKLTKEERISKRENVKHLLDRYIFYPISTWPSSIRETLKHDTIMNKNTLKLTPFAFSNGISPNVFTEYHYTFILNTPPKIGKRTHQLQWIITNINTHQHKWYYFDMYITSYTQSIMNTCITHTNTHTHTHINTHYLRNNELLHNKSTLHFTGHGQPSW